MLRYEKIEHSLKVSSVIFVYTLGTVVLKFEVNI